MKNLDASYKNRLAALTLIITFIVVDIVLGFYHLTHGGGWVSGSIELLFSVLMGMAGTFILNWKQKENSAENSYSYLRIAKIIISLIALVVLILSIYHFTHNGFPSGIIELVMTMLLVTILYLIK
jgi:Co/Zn/Cd efflux system component